VKHQLNPQATVRDYLAQYLDYMGSPGRGSDVVKISFVSEGRDNELDEGVFLVQIRKESRSLKPDRNQGD
jgi:hypothetical protein